MDITRDEARRRIDSTFARKILEDERHVDEILDVLGYTDVDHGDAMLTGWIGLMYDLTDTAELYHSLLDRMSEEDADAKMEELKAIIGGCK